MWSAKKPQNVIVLPSTKVLNTPFDVRKQRAIATTQEALADDSRIRRTGLAFPFLRASPGGETYLLLATRQGRLEALTRFDVEEAGLGAPLMLAAQAAATQALDACCGAFFSQHGAATPGWELMPCISIEDDWVIHTVFLEYGRLVTSRSAPCPLTLADSCCAFLSRPHLHPHLHPHSCLAMSSSSSSTDAEDARDAYWGGEGMDISSSSSSNKENNAAVLCPNPTPNPQTSPFSPPNNERLLWVPINELITTSNASYLGLPFCAFLRTVMCSALARIIQEKILRHPSAAPLTASEQGYYGALEPKSVRASSSRGALKQKIPKSGHALAARFWKEHW